MGTIMETTAMILFLLMLCATLGLAAIAWLLRFVQYPLLMRVGRRRFAVYARSLFSVLMILTAPLMIVELAATVGFSILLPQGVSRDLGWVGLLLLSLIWGVTLFHHRPAVRLLMVEFNPATLRRLLCAQWVRAIAWSFRAIIALLMLLQMMRT